MAVRLSEGPGAWLIISSKCLPQWGLVWGFLQRVHVLETQGRLDKRESPGPPTPSEMPLSLGNMQHPGGISQEVFGAIGARFSPKLWQALPALSQRIGKAGSSFL